MRSPNTFILRLFSTLLLILGVLTFASCGGVAKPDLTFTPPTLHDALFSEDHPWEILVTNQAPVEISGIQLTGLSAPIAFMGGAYPGTGGTCSTTLPSQGQCTIRLLFSAPAPPMKRFNQSLKVSYNRENNRKTLTVPLRAESGNGPFNQARGFSEAVRSILRVGDRFYVAGNFKSYDGQPAGAIIAFGFNSAQPLSSFDIGDGFDGTSVVTLAPASGNRIYAGGGFRNFRGESVNRFIRLLPNGQRDTSFDVGSGFNSSVASALPAPDGTGDIFVAGSFTTYKGAVANRVIRLTSTGAPSPSFSSPGVVNQPVNAIAIDALGRIYLGGLFTTVAGESYSRLVRLLPDGSIDTTFVVGTGFDLTVHTLLTTADNKVYVGGSFSTYKSVAQPYFVRLDANGDVDGSFAMGSGFNFVVRTLIRDPDSTDHIIVGGSFNSYNGHSSRGAMRLHTDGSVDTGFSTPFGSFSTVYSIMAWTGVAAGWILGGEIESLDGNLLNGIARANSTGGYVSWFTTGNGFSGTLTSIEADTNDSGGVFVGGSFMHYGGTARNRIIRLTRDGLSDPSFSPGTGFFNTVNALKLSSDNGGTLYVGGAFTSFAGSSAVRIVRLFKTGARDTDFVVGAGFNGDVHTLAVPTSGTGIYVGGAFAEYQENPAPRLARISPNGSADPGFNVGTGFDGNVYSIVANPLNSGQIYVAGAFENYQGEAAPRIVRLNADGTRDLTFAVGSGFDAEVRSLVTHGGSIYVTGNFTTYQGQPAGRLVRLHSNGTRNTQFSPSIGLEGGRGQTLMMAPDSSGDILVGGYFTHFEGEPRGYLLRLNSQGQIATSFQSQRGATSPVTAFAAAPDGTADIYAAGFLRTFNGVTVDYLTRFSPSGKVD